MTSSNGRRRALAGLAAIAAGALGAFAAGRPARAQAKPRPIVQPKAASATAFIARAFALRDQASRAGDQARWLVKDILAEESGWELPQDVQYMMSHQGPAVIFDTVGYDNPAMAEIVAMKRERSDAERWGDIPDW